jgi:hypothetical protein
MQKACTKLEFNKELIFIESFVSLVKSDNLYLSNCLSASVVFSDFSLPSWNLLFPIIIAPDNPPIKTFLAPSSDKNPSLTPVVKASSQLVASLLYF